MWKTEYLTPLDIFDFSFVYYYTEIFHLIENSTLTYFGRSAFCGVSKWLIFNCLYWQYRNYCLCTSIEFKPEILRWVVQTVNLCLLGQENEHQQLGPHREYAVNNALTLVNHHNVGSDPSLSTLHSIFSRGRKSIYRFGKPIFNGNHKQCWHIWVYSAFYAVAMYLWTQVQQDIHVRLSPNP